ncbi:MAG: CBS domain-containing protein [Verrucomicrobiae bacterium]|nr:CBS domain-containing protein [Verrucomicrobiae bacterium]NNJ86393.1 CBS domain-containing protein [Akkermansiaceae bacterium]
MEQSLEDVIKDKDGRICTVDPEATIDEAAKVMKQERVGALLVMDGDWVIGVLTERDFVYRVLAAGLDVNTTKVHQVMSKDVVVVKPALKIQDAMQVISEKRFRHLPVVSEGRLIGVVSSGDLTRRIVAEREGMIDTLYDYIHGSYPG